jgi:hypothetical protein
MIAWLAWPVGGFAVAALSHAALSRLAPRSSRVITFFLLAAAIGTGMVWLAATRNGLWSAQTIAAAFVYAALCELYIFVFTLAMASVSANLLVRLRQGGLSPEDISRLYDGRTMAARRVERLLATALAREEGGLLRLTPRGDRLTNAFIAIRGFLHPGSRPAAGVMGQSDGR